VPHRFFLLLTSALLSGSPLLHAAPAETTLASGGKAVQEIFVGGAPSERVQAAAETLADYLGRISGGEFKVSPGNGTTGIAVGLATDFPEVDLGVTFDTKDPQRREDYVLRTHDNGIYLIGSTDLAVENAVWDLLYRFGHRQFFPGENWEIVPKNPELKIAVDAFEEPDHSFRKVWYGYNGWPENRARTEVWRSRNRMQTAFTVYSTHVYSNIIAAFPEEIAAHPEYVSQVDGKPTNQLNISNPGARALAVKWALDKLEKNPELEVTAMDPSDGGGWGHSEAEDAMGPISNRVTLLANEVAEAINEKYGEEYGKKYVGLYGYNQHAMPPTIPVDPRVIVMVATMFNKSGLSQEDLLAGWQKQGATVGIRDYYNIGSSDLPGKASASNVQRIADNIAKYHNLGARFLSAEGADSWGVCGIGYYVSSRVSWDVKEATRVPELIEDFLEKSFGDAKEPMTDFYDLMTPPTFLSESDLGKMYRSLDQARKLTKDPGVLARVNDLLIYTRYVDVRQQFNDLVKKASTATVAERQEAFAEMMKFLYRARHSHMVHGLLFWRDMPKRNKDLRDLVLFNAPDNPWKSEEPISNEELDAWMKDGLARNQIVDYEPVKYSMDLVPATELQLDEVPRLPSGNFLRNNILYVWVEEAGKPIHLTTKTSLVKTALNKGRILLQKVDSAADKTPSWQEGLTGYVDELAGEAESTVEQTDVVAESSVEILPMEEPQKVQLIPKQTGLYRIIVESRVKSGTEIDWDQSLSVVHESTDAHSLQIHHRTARYFYVPKGTRYVAGFIQRSGVVLDPAGKAVFTVTANNGSYFNLPVEDGMDGKLWTIQGGYITPRLLTVPPFLARSASELMLPREVVEADKPRP